MSAPTPREYAITTDSMDTAIKRTLISDDDIMCVIAEHISNPWGVLKGYSPDYDGVDGITRFRNDCVESFCKRANYIYEHDRR